MRTNAFILSVLMLLALTLPLRAEDSPSITTWGKATLYVTPDRAVISLSVHSADVEIAKAIGDNVADADRLLKALKAMGIEEKAIASGYISVNTGNGFLFGLRQADDPRVHVFRSYTITVSDLKLIDKVLDTAMKNGANEVDGVDLQTSQLAQFRDQARQQAVRAAKAKAVLLAKELDVTVGKPKVINETNANSYVSSGGITGSGPGIAGPEEPEPAQVFVVGKIPVEAAVRVTFELK